MITITIICRKHTEDDVNISVETAFFLKQNINSDKGSWNSVRTCYPSRNLVQQLYANLISANCLCCTYVGYTSTQSMTSQHLHLSSAVFITKVNYFTKRRNICILKGPTTYGHSKLKTVCFNIKLKDRHFQYYIIQITSRTEENISMYFMYTLCRQCQ